MNKIHNNYEFPLNVSCLFHTQLNLDMEIDSELQWLKETQEYQFFKRIASLPNQTEPNIAFKDDFINQLILFGSYRHFSL